MSSPVVTLTYECQQENCDGVATDGGTLHTELDTKIELDIDMTFSQITLTCQECGHKYYTGDIDIFDEDEV